MIKKLCSFLLFVHFSAALFAQCLCVQVDKKVGCVPLSVTLSNCGTGTQLLYSFDALLPYGTITTHEYKQPGVYSVTQSGNCPGGLLGVDTSLAVLVTVKPVPDVQLSYLPCAKGKSLIIASDPNYDIFELSQNGGPITNLNKNQTTIWQMQSGVFGTTLDVKGLYSGANCGKTGTLVLSSYDALVTPVITSFTLENNAKAVMQFSTNNYQRYELRKKVGLSGSYVAVDTIQNVQGIQTFTFDNLSTSTNAYCFQIRTFDYCGQQEAFTSEYCTILLSGTAQNKENNLFWQADAKINTTDFQLSIDTKNSTSFTSRPNPTSFVDTNILCGKQYCYQVTAAYPDGIKSISNSVCLTAISTSIPPTIPEINASVLGDIVQLNWLPTSASRYNVLYSTNKTTYANLGSTTSASYNDSQNNPNNASFCYKVSYDDNCGNTSLASPEVCPVFLRGKVNDAASRTITWTSYTGWAEGVQEYVVEKYDETGKVYFSQNLGLAFDFTDKGLDTSEQIIRYRIKAVSNSGRVSYSNTWKLEQKGGLYMPNAFTPNGDGLNDIFHADGLFIRYFKLEIWNRNGEGVFSSSSFAQGWDGKINGQSAPVDTYMYKVDATDKLGVTYKRSGTLQLIK